MTHIPLPRAISWPLLSRTSRARALDCPSPDDGRYRLIGEVVAEPEIPAVDGEPGALVDEVLEAAP